MTEPLQQSLIEKIKERCDLSEKDPWVYLDDVEEIISQHHAAPDVASEISVDWDAMHRDLAEVVANGWSYGDHPRHKAKVIIDAIKPYFATRKPVSVSQIAAKVNPCDEGDMEFYKDHVRTVLDAAEVKYVD